MLQEANDTRSSAVCVRRLVSSAAILCLAMVASFNTALADDKIDAELVRIVTRLEDKDPQVRMSAFMDLHRWYRSRCQGDHSYFHRTVEGQS